MKLTPGDLGAMGLRVLAARLFGRGFPLTLYMALTDRCPTRCRYCAIPTRRQADLPADLAISAAVGAARLGMKRLQLVGGEPLCHPELGTILAGAKQHRLFVTLSTGGTLVPGKVDLLRDVDIVFVSLDGDREVHDCHRGEGTFDRTMAGIDALRREGIRYWTTTVVTARNHDRLHWVADFAAKHGHTANFQLLYSSGGGGERHFHPPEHPGLSLTHGQARAAVAVLLDLKRKGAPVGNSAAALRYLLQWPDLTVNYGSRRGRGPACLAGKLYCYLDTDGSLYPCGDAIGRVEGVSLSGPGGFGGAFSRLGALPCASCTIGCNLEQNLLFSFDAGTVRNWLGRVGR